MNNGKILILGGAGFIGSILTKRLISYGVRVKVADNLYKGADSLLHLVNNPLFEFEYCDITKGDQVNKLFKDEDIEGVILLSGIVGLDACNKNESLAVDVNVNGWKNVMLAKPEKIPLVAASTGSVYGEIKNGLCSETETVPNPLSVYGVTKLEGEKWVTAHRGVALRFATCAGVSPNFRLNLLPNELCWEAITKKVINVFEKDNKRTFIDIRDFADALWYFLAEAKNGTLKHNIYNIGHPSNNLTKGELAEKIREKTGCYVNYVDTFKDADARNYEVDHSLMNEAGFRCFYSLDQTLNDLLKAIPLLKLNQKYF